MHIIASSLTALRLPWLDLDHLGLPRLLHSEQKAWLLSLCGPWAKLFQWAASGPPHILTLRRDCSPLIYTVPTFRIICFADVCFRHVVVILESVITKHRAFWLRDRTAQKTEQILFDPQSDKKQSTNSLIHHLILPILILFQLVNGCCSKRSRKIGARRVLTVG